MNSLVEIIGIRGYEKTIKLKANVKEALRILGLKISLTEITDLDAMMKSEITSMPALRVNGKVIVQQTLPSVEDLKNLLKSILQPSKIQLEMKKIIVPTDFSYAAKDALDFAQEIAPIVASSIKVIHIYRGNFNTNQSLNIKSGKGRRETLLDDLNDFVYHNQSDKQVAIQPKIKIECEAVSGFTESKIVEYSELPDTEMIVMGTTGKRGMIGKLFGTISTGVSRRAHCPVILIPKGVAFTGFRNILFASNYHSVEKNTLHRLEKFATAFQSSIHFVHVLEGDGLNDWQMLSNQILDVFAKPASPLTFNAVSINADSVVEGINTYALQNEIDLIVMGTPRQSFWETLIQKSRIKDFAFASTVPIMVYHTDL